MLNCLPGAASIQNSKRVNYDEPVVVLSSRPPEVLASANGSRGRLRQVCST